MSMSEFERQPNAWDRDFSTLSMQGHDLPADFGDDDMAFAQELDELFRITRRRYPPYYVQTLLDSEEPRFQPVEQGFELKTRARVFRRLKLRRRLFQRNRPSLHSLVSEVPVRRSLTAGAAFLLVVFMTVMLTGASFASGVAILVHGVKSGVFLVHEYSVRAFTFPYSLRRTTKRSSYTANNHPVGCPAAAPFMEYVLASNVTG